MAQVLELLLEQGEAALAEWALTSLDQMCQHVEKMDPQQG